MKTTRNTLTVVMMVAAMGLATGAQAGTISTSTTAPTVDGADIAMLDLTGAVGVGKFWSGEGFAAGQTFTTGSDSGGYLLNAATIRYHGTYDPNNQNTEYDPTKTYGVRVVTLSGTTITQLHDESCVHSVASRAGDYLTFTLDSPFALSPDTEYGFDVRMTNTTSHWSTGIPTVSRGDDNYAGGKSYKPDMWTDGNRGSWSATDLALAKDIRDGDWVFHLDMEPAAPPTGFLHIMKFWDRDGDGQQGPNEQDPLGAGMFEYDLVNVDTGEQFLVTNCEEFELPVGAYTGTERLWGDWRVTTGDIGFTIDEDILTEITVGNAVPEPASAMLLCLGIGAVAGRVRRRLRLA